ncbi:hypothetical protein [Serratia symbiotica]|uniref:hypothetical protein n=1 Tax=Serratia symbiotica TaxID=138074 RepID=UPI0030CCD760
MYALPESCPFRGLFIPNPISDLFNNADTHLKKKIISARWAVVILPPYSIERAERL